MGRLRARGDLKGSNAASHLDLVLADVAKLNEELRFDEADALFDVEEKRMREAHVATEERQAEEARQLLQQRLDQDRIRNRPDLVAKRLIADLGKQAHLEGLFRARNTFCFDWMQKADASGDMFGLRVALEMAKANYEKAKGKRVLESVSLNTLGVYYFNIAERSLDPRSLILARNAFEGALKKTSKSKEPLHWASFQASLGSVLREIGECEKHEGFVREAVRAHQDSLAVRQAHESEYQKSSWNNLGTALLSLGELTRDVDVLKHAIDALENALDLKDKEREVLDWELTKNNLGLAQRWLGAMSGDLEMLKTARASYKACEEIDFRDQANFTWAMLQWIIADLALARFQLEPDAVLLIEARAYVGRAREVFEDGSDYQTQRCDDLIARIEAA